MRKYIQSCKSEFWQEVFSAELDYVLRQLKDAADVLSVGCGPAVIEAGLVEHGLNVTGLDISREALNQAPDTIRTIAGSAENMDFPKQSFDAVIYVASLQFIQDYKKAVRETVRVLRKNGLILALLLNPGSQFFKDRDNNPDSYIRRIKHTRLDEIQNTIVEYFTVRTKYILGVQGRRIFETADPNWAALYVIKGNKKLERTGYN